MTFRSWDQSTGEARNRTDVTTSGGSTAFGAASDTASIEVTNVKDAPVLDAMRSPTLPAPTQLAGLPSGAVGVALCDVVDARVPSSGLDNVADVDPALSLGVAVTAVDTAH